MFKLPTLPYKQTDLAPWLTPETFEFHYGKHHKTYIDNMNKLIDGTPNAEKTLEQLALESSGGLFNNAAQSWNHTFYWFCLTPKATPLADAGLLAAINKSFESLDQFKAKFIESAIGNFGSGWTWLVQEKSGGLKLVNTSNAEVPFKDGSKPLLVCDVWEHAYYIDFRNDRKRYVTGFLDRIDWNFVAKNFAGTVVANMTALMK